MTVQLLPEEQRWPEAQDDLDWAKPLVDAASAELARGEGISGDEAIARIRAALDRSF
jgi:hypothetical protein